MDLARKMLAEMCDMMRRVGLETENYYIVKKNNGENTCEKKIMGYQPAKKKITKIAEFNNIFVYSPKKNKAKFIAEYSKL